MTKILIPAALAASLISCTMSAAYGQGVPGTRLTVDVTVLAARQRGDTAEVRYRLANKKESKEQVSTFVVLGATTSILRMVPGASPDKGWDASTRVHSGPAALWGTLSFSILQPGESWSPFIWSGIGLPSIAEYRVGGYFPPPVMTENDRDDDPVVDVLRVHAIGGFTVGIEALPTDRSVAALIQRLQSLVKRSCELRWIDERRVCRSIETDLGDAQRFVVELKPRQAKNAIERALERVELEDDERRSRRISANAYWLLKPNIDYILRQLRAQLPGKDREQESDNDDAERDGER